MNAEEKLHQLGINLPAPPPPAGAYVPVMTEEKLLFVSGQLPISEGKVIYTGKVGADLDLTQAQQAARLCLINALAAIKGHIGSLDQVRQMVRMEVFVNSASGFIEQPQVANAASQLLEALFGARGRHARLAVGVAQLPLDAAVELALIAAIG